jgi:hypothetical protein
VLSILEANAGDAQPMPIGVFEIMDPNGSKAARTNSSQLTGIAIGRPTAPAAAAGGIAAKLHAPLDLRPPKRRAHEYAGGGT